MFGPQNGEGSKVILEAREQLSVWKVFSENDQRLKTFPESRGERRSKERGREWFPVTQAAHNLSFWIYSLTLFHSHGASSFFFHQKTFRLLSQFNRITHPLSHTQQRSLPLQSLPFSRSPFLTPKPITSQSSGWSIQYTTWKRFPARKDFAFFSRSPCVCESMLVSLCSKSDWEVRFVWSQSLFLLCVSQ